MSAQIYPGIKSLHLVVDTPYDLIRTTDIRDDLESIKVWFSTTSGFDPKSTNPANRGTLFSNGIDKNITISNLAANTRYYVRYAFISKIEPDNFTVSPQLTQVVYDENISIYGYLTNDPTAISTAADGTGGNFTLATGVFKVFKLSEDKTGAGPVYSIKANSNFYLTGATINSTTGVYSCTGMTQNSGSVTFLATYEGVVVEQVWNVYRGLAGEKAPLIQISATNSDFIYKDQYATTSETTSTEITAKLTNLTGSTATFTAQAFKRDGTLLGSVLFTQTVNKIVITQAQFGALGITVGFVIVTATVGTVSDSFTLYRINDGTEQITVELSNSAHVIPAANNGGTVPLNYLGSGTVIKVKEGIKYLNVDSDSPYESVATWNIFNITSVNITCDPTPTVGSNSINFDTHAAMTADQAHIDYTIEYRTTSGVTGTQVVRQSFAKSKEGVIGSTARAVDITASKQAFLTPKNSNTTTESTILLTATASNFTNPQYVWLVDGIAPAEAIGVVNGVNGNTFTLKSFAAIAAKSVKVTVSEGLFSAFDIFSVYSLKDGDDSIVTSLSNENQTISCDSTGTPIAGQTVTSKFYVVQGFNFLTGATTPAVTFAPVSYNGGNAGSYRINSLGDIQIDSINTQFASAVFSATVNGVTFFKTLTLNKSIDGSSAPVVNLTVDTQLFIAAKNTGVVSPLSVTFTLSTYNLGASPQIVWKIDGVVQTGQSGYTLSVPRFSTGTKLVRAEVTANGVTVFDQITLYALKEGDDSIAAGLVNENQTITCDSTGQVIGTVSLTSSLGAARGSTMLTYPTVVFSKVSQDGLTATIDPETGAISVTGITAANNVYAMSATFRATVGAVTVDRTLTVNKSLNGKTPVKGTDYVDGKSTYTATVYLQQATAPSSAPTGGSYNFSTNFLTAPAGWDKTLPASSDTLTTYASQYTFVTTVPGDTISGGTWSVGLAYVKNGAKGDPGTSTYTATVYLLSSSYPSALGTPPPAPIGGTYNFSNSTLVAPAGGWLVSQPESSAFYPTWAADYTFTTTTPTITVGGGQWGNRRVLITVPKEGTPGARNATGFLYSQVSATSPPLVATPDITTWSWTTGQFGTPSTTGSWAHTPISPAAGQKAYAVRYNVTESAYGVTPVSVQLGTVITSITFDGLVTFTDLSAKADSSSITGTANTAITNSISSGTIKTALDTKISTGGGATDINNYRNTTTILGSAITTGTIEANALKIGDTSRVGARIEITNTNMTVYSAGTTTYPNGVKRVIIGFLG